MGIGLRQTMRGSMFRSLRDLAAEDDAQGAPGSGGGTAPINPLASVDWVYDPNVNTLAVNADGSGGVPAVGGNVGLIAVTGTNQLPNTVNRFDAAKDGVRPGPILRSGVGGNKYLEHTGSLKHYLETPAVSGQPGTPFTMILLCRVPVGGRGWMLGSSAFSRLISADPATTIAMYNGGTSATATTTAATWHVVAFVANSGTSADLWIDGVRVLTGVSTVGSTAMGQSLTIGDGANHFFELNDASAGTATFDWGYIAVKNGLPAGYASSDFSALKGWMAFAGAYQGVTIP